MLGEKERESTRIYPAVTDGHRGKQKKISREPEKESPSSATAIILLGSSFAERRKSL